MSNEVLTRPGSAFSNSTEWDIWSANWCDRCTKDADFQAGKSELGCDLILIAMCGDEIPAAWMDTEPGCHDRYRCIEFRSTDDGNGGDDPEPKPLPEPPDMDGLFDRPERGVRMYVHPEMWPVKA